MIKKYLTLITTGLLIAGSAQAYNYNLKVDNKTPLKTEFSWDNGGSSKTIPSGKATQLDSANSDTIYEIHYNGTQIFASIKQDSDYFVLQATPMMANPAWQDVKVQLTANGSGGKKTGSYQTVRNDAGKLVYNGVCQPDGAGLTCKLSNHNGTINNLDITLTGGHEKPPMENYVIPAYPEGNDQVPEWSADKTYGQWRSDGLHERVKYQGQQYVACWWVKGDAPTTNDAWKVFNPNKNVCQA